MEELNYIFFPFAEKKWNTNHTKFGRGLINSFTISWDKCEPIESPKLFYSRVGSYDEAKSRYSHASKWLNEKPIHRWYCTYGRSSGCKLILKVTGGFTDARNLTHCEPNHVKTAWWRVFFSSQVLATIFIGKRCLKRWFLISKFRGVQWLNSDTV